MDNNPVGDAGAAGLFRMGLPHNVALRVLSMDCCRISDVATDALIAVVKGSTANYNEILSQRNSYSSIWGDEGRIYGPGLLTLSLGGNFFTAVTAKMFFDFLASEREEGHQNLNSKKRRNSQKRQKVESRRAILAAHEERKQKKEGSEISDTPTFSEISDFFDVNSHIKCCSECLSVSLWGVSSSPGFPSQLKVDIYHSEVQKRLTI